MIDFVEGDRLEKIFSRGRKRRKKSDDGVGVFLGKMTKIQLHNQSRENPKLDEPKEKLFWLKGRKK